jgi:hypothetical protein
MVVVRENALLCGAVSGLVYQEVPQPGFPGLGSPRSAAEYDYNSGAILGGSGHLRVTVNESEIKVEYVRAFLPKEENERQKSGQVGHVYTVPVCREPRHETPLSVAPSNRHPGAQGDLRPEDLGPDGRTSPALGLLVRMSPSQEG